MEGHGIHTERTTHDAGVRAMAWGLQSQLLGPMGQNIAVGTESGLLILLPMERIPSMGLAEQLPWDRRHCMRSGGGGGVCVRESRWAISVLSRVDHRRIATGRVPVALEGVLAGL